MARARQPAMGYLIGPTGQSEGRVSVQVWLSRACGYHQRRSLPILEPKLPASGLASSISKEASMSGHSKTRKLQMSAIRTSRLSGQAALSCRRSCLAALSPSGAVNPVDVG
jgi:hypothetical protein